MRRGDLLVSSCHAPAGGVAAPRPRPAAQRGVRLKVLRPDAMRDDPSLLDRFKQTARRITHRNVLRTQFGGRPYISIQDLRHSPQGPHHEPRARSISISLRIAKQM